MLTSGMVPALFPDDEKESIIGQVTTKSLAPSTYQCSPLTFSLNFSPQVRDEVQKAGLLPTRESCWSYFVKKSANNLHIVLCMSPVGDTLRTRCRNFPGLVNNTSIDWFTAWPQQALHAVASHFLAEVCKLTKNYSAFLVQTIFQWLTW